MKGYPIEPGSTVERMIGLEITGNVVPLEWFKHIRHENGKPYSLAILILADVVYWYRPIEERDEATGFFVAYRKKFAADWLQRSYTALAEQYGYTKEQVKDALRYLRDNTKVISLDFRDILKTGQIYNNVMFIGLNVERLKQITFTPLPTLKQGGVPTLNTPPPNFKAGSPPDFKAGTYTETPITEITGEITKIASADAPALSPQNGNGVVKNPRAFAALQTFESRQGEVDFSHYPEDVREIIREFFRLWKVVPPARPRSKKGGEYALWISGARELREACGEFGLSALQAYYEEWQGAKPDDRYMPGRPGALKYFVNATAGKLRMQGSASPVETFEEFSAMMRELGEEPTRRDYELYLANKGVKA